MAVVAACEPLQGHRDCPFRCLGCAARSSPVHETEALTQHLRLVLKAVLGLQSVLGCRGEVGSTAVVEAEAVAEMARTPSTSSTMPVEGVQRAAHSPSRQGNNSDTGNYDLLRLLHGSDPDEDRSERRSRPGSPAPSSPPSPPPSPKNGGCQSPLNIAVRNSISEQPHQAIVAVESSREEDTAGRPIALVPTLPLPGYLASPSRNAVESHKVSSPTRQGAERSEHRVPSPTRGAAEVEAQRMLNSVTAELQEGKISHAQSAERFSELINTLPSGKLRCSALLNRAHCLVGLSRYADALVDIDEIVEEDPPGVEAAKWHKVWLSRGGIHRKLAQAAGGDPVLFARARSDYEHVLAIEPPHESSVSKARRGLEQLDILERPTNATRASSSSAGPRISDALSTTRGEEKAGRLSVSPEMPSGVRGSSTAQTGREPEEEPSRTPSPRQRSPLKRSVRTSIGGQASAMEPDEECKAKRCRGGVDAIEAQVDASSSSGRPHGVSAFDMDSIHRNLLTLGRDCAVAGRALFEEGSVHERSSAQTPNGGEALEGLASPPRAKCRRIFDIRSPLGGPVEVVELSCSASSRGGDNRTFGTADASRIGDCSCRLRGHCKHMAAVLIALEREAISSSAGLASSGTGHVAPARAGDSVARARRDALEQRLERFTIEELKSYLRLNNQLLSGTKVDLVRRVADGVVFGALPQCPNCAGHLHPEANADGDQPSFRCRKLNRDREPCGYEISIESVVRRPFIGADQLS